MAQRNQRFLKRALLAAVIAAIAANGLLVYRVSCQVPGTGEVVDWHWGLTQVTPAICDTMSVSEYLLRNEVSLAALVLVAILVAALLVRRNNARGWDRLRGTGSSGGG